MFINHDAASSQRGPETRRWDLKNSIAELNRIVFTDDAFMLDREDPIQVEMSYGNESRVRLGGLHREFPIEFGDVVRSQKMIGFIHRTDIANTELLR